MDFTGILQNNWRIFAIMGIVCVGSMIFNIIRGKMTKSSNQAFLAEHPDAAKVFLTMKAFITSKAVTVSSVDGEAPRFFQEGGKTGFYALPGKRSVDMNYSYTRPGVLYKNVTKSTGMVTKELVTEAGKSYLLGFDRENETFTFDEV